jgi:hypothetical protein
MVSHILYYSCKRRCTPGWTHSYIVYCCQLPHYTVLFFSIITRLCPVDAPSPLRWNPSVLWLSDGALRLIVVRVHVDWDTNSIPLCVAFGVTTDAFPYFHLKAIRNHAHFSGAIPPLSPVVSRGRIGLSPPFSPPAPRHHRSGLSLMPVLVPHPHYHL